MRRRRRAWRQEARAKVEQLEQDLQDRETTTFAVVADMARQYKALQEALIFKINALETQLMEHHDEFEISSHQLRELALDQDEVLQAKDAQIRQLHERIEEMTAEFASMVSASLELLKQQGEAGSMDQDVTSTARHTGPNFEASAEAAPIFCCGSPAGRLGAARLVRGCA